jgi:hypothetical protein
MDFCVGGGSVMDNKPASKKEATFWITLMTMAFAYGMIEPIINGAV